MTSDEPIRAAPAGSRLANRLRDRLRATAAVTLLRAAPPLARRRAQQAEMAGALARLQAEFEHVRERHDEQIERLEDLVRELVLAVEALRRDISARERRD
jgi:molecular chaperone GrpE (heat shock protein)